jgi:hypothetical protein
MVIGLLVFVLIFLFAYVADLDVNKRKSELLKTTNIVKNKVISPAEIINFLEEKPNLRIVELDVCNFLNYSNTTVCDGLTFAEYEFKKLSLTKEYLYLSEAHFLCQLASIFLKSYFMISYLDLIIFSAVLKFSGVFIFKS